MVQNSKSRSEKLITVGEAAEMLVFSRCYVERLLKEGKIPFSMVDGNTRLVLKDVIDNTLRRTGGMRCDSWLRRRRM